MTSIIKVNTFQDTNGNALFNSDGSGNVTLSAGAMKNTPAFSAVLTSNQTIGNSTNSLIAFDTVEIDTDSAFTNTSSNYKFTVPSGKAGKYYFNMMIRSGSITDGKKIVGYLMKNGVEIDPGQFMNVSSNGSEQYSVIVTALFDMSVGDYAVAKVLHQSGGAVTFGAIGGVFQGFKLIE